MKENFQKILLFLAFISFSTLLIAQIPKGYYNAAEGMRERGLKSELSRIISNGYVTKSYDFLYTIYETSDNKVVSGKNYVWDMYSTCTWTHGNKRCGSTGYKNVCDCYNREHSIPQSWFSSASPMVSDAFHVYPTDGKVNGQRSNFPFGECGMGTTLTNGLGKLGTSTFSGYTKTVFEPVDEFKGDFARTYFYFVTRYENKISGFSGESFARNTYPSLSSWSINMFLKWHRQDPVSKKEIDRNNAVHKHQNNRNPFIDYPILAEHIWGNKMTEDFYLSGSGIEHLSVDATYELGYTDGKLQILNNSSEGILEIYTIHGQLVTKQPVGMGDTEISVPLDKLLIVRLNGFTTKLSTH